MQKRKLIQTLKYIFCITALLMPKSFLTVCAWHFKDVKTFVNGCVKSNSHFFFFFLLLQAVHVLSLSAKTQMFAYFKLAVQSFGCEDLICFFKDKTSELQQDNKLFIW